MISCPDCGSETSVIESRSTKDSRRRRRQCKACGRRFTTYEVSHPLEPVVSHQMDRTARELDCLADLLRDAKRTSERVALMLDCKRLAEVLRRLEAA